MSPNVNELILRAQRGDRRSFETLYKEYYAGVLGFIKSKVRNEHTAQDLASETFLKAWQNIAEVVCDPERNVFQGWLFTIAHNVTMDHFRRLRCRPPESLVGDGSYSAKVGASPEALFMRGVSIETVLRASSLSLQEKQCIILSYFVDLTTKDVAEVMGKSVRAITSVRYRALRKLRGVVNL